MGGVSALEDLSNFINDSVLVFLCGTQQVRLLKLRKCIVVLFIFLANLIQKIKDLDLTASLCGLLEFLLSEIEDAKSLP